MILFSAPDEFRRAFCVEGFDPFPEIIRLAQPAVAMAFQFDRNRQRAILGIVQKFLCRPLRERREAASSSTSLSVAFSSSASGTHSVAMPHSMPAWPEMRLERITMSLVRVMPTIFCRRAEPPDPGI